MDDWTKFKNRIRTSDPDLAEDLKEVEELSTKLVNNIKHKRRDLSKTDPARQPGAH